MNFKVLIVSVSVVLMPFVASAQQDGALSFLRISQDAISSGMAGAGYVESVDNPTSVIDNGGVALVGMNLWKASSSNYYSALCSYRIGKSLGVGIEGVYGNGKAYDIYSESGQKNGSYTPTEQNIGVSVSYKVIPALSLGVKLRAAKQSLAEKASYSAYCVDFIASTNFGPVRASAGVVALGSKVKSASGSEFSLPGSAKLGLGYSGSAGVISYGAYLDADYFLSSSALGASVGAKVSYNEMVNLKAGFHFGSKNCILPSYASVGLGGAFKSFILDAAVLFGGMQSGTILVNLGYRV